jgi:pullulanase/glycogen debranching enzyme
VPKSVVVDETFDWGDDTPPRVPWSQTITYEAHVKGLTARHPDVIEAQRGNSNGDFAPESRYSSAGEDPVLAQVKLIAQPLDVGEYGYQVGNFPPNWSEWNGKMPSDRCVYAVSRWRSRRSGFQECRGS